MSSGSEPRSSPTTLRSFAGFSPDAGAVNENEACDAPGFIASYNFTTLATQAYNGNQVELYAGATPTGIFALYSGDIVKDAGESVDLFDLGALETDQGAFAFGYLSTDLNGDGNVDLLDSPSIESNISNFIFSQHPL